MKFTIESARSLKSLKDSGTLIPCSPFAAKFAVKRVNIKKANTIVEVGCGTGVFTKEIIKQKKKDALVIGIEINKKLAQATQKKVKEAIIYNKSAEQINTILKEQKRTKADCIISTLPWAVFKKEKQEKILDKLYNALEEGGEFITIGYFMTNQIKTGKQLRKLLEERFKKVTKTRHVVANVPPVFFYHCKK